MRQPNRHRFTNLGFSTILLAFSMICIVMFSALTLITANSDYRLSQKVANKNSSYYIAEEKAYEELSLIDQTLQKIYLSTHNSKDFCRKAKNKLSKLKLNNTALQISDSEANSHSLNCHFSEVLSEQQTLEITLSISYPHTDSMSFYSITQWQTITKEFEEENEPLHLIGSN